MVIRLIIDKDVDIVKTWELVQEECPAWDENDEELVSSLTMVTPISS